MVWACDVNEGNGNRRASQDERKTDEEVGGQFESRSEGKGLSGEEV